ncbi:hypothetical protein [Burkholderia ubonensis]|uniref:hypothetical protein n=1 Tax=Burkholderia ubonensis TaxID=101571 RepID=UPI0002D89702|nr:hypothetical protein [Burkholderia ubonensis]
MSWTREQRNVTIAAYLGWTLDAFDFFLMVFVLKDIAAEFNSTIPAVAFALTLTLAMRPLGALIFGRRRTILVAALIALPVLPLWAYSSGPLALAAGAFLMQISVQGAWGIIPVHLNEISPDEIRATFPGFVYQLGNLLASGNATMQASVAVSHGNNYSFALALVCGIVAIVIAVLIMFSPERRGVDMTQSVNTRSAVG